MFCIEYIIPKKVSKKKKNVWKLQKNILYCIQIEWAKAEPKKSLKKEKKDLEMSEILFKFVVDDWENKAKAELKKKFEKRKKVLAYLKNSF